MSNRGVALRWHAVQGSAEEQTCAPRRENMEHVETGRAAVAGYIADMTAQFESMAAAAGLDLLAYFLAMARAEATSNVDAGAVSEEAP